MRYLLLTWFICFFSSTLFSQTLIESYYLDNHRSMIPKSMVEMNGQVIIPYSILENDTRLPGLAFLEGSRLVNSLAFQGDNEYVINQLVVSEDSNLLVSAEGYSYSGQESLYFMELENGQVVNEFIFNENGNELDPFALVENNEQVIVAGFLKERDLISNSFYNMYSEEQFIYIGEFLKSGEKVWSKTISIDGFKTGICNAMIKHSNQLFLLCHAQNSNQQLSTFLIRVDMQGNVISIKEFFLSNTHLTSNLMQIKNDQIHLTGTYLLNDNHHVFKMVLDPNLKMVSQSEYTVDNRLIINGGYGQLIYGGLLSPQEGFNYALLNFDGSEAELYQFGSVKSEQLVGVTDTMLYAYSLSSSEQKTASWHVFNYQIHDMDFKALNPSNKNIYSSIHSNFSVNSKFTKSTINEGVEKLKMQTNFQNIRQVTP